MTRLFLILCLAFFSFGCDDDSSDDGQDMGAAGAGGEGGEGGGETAEFPLVGTWDDGFGTHVITTDRWTISFEGMEPSIFHIEEIELSANYVIAVNDDDNMFNAGAWSRFDWAEVEGQLYLCQSSFDSESADAARMAMADASDPASGGCGEGENNFPWSPLEPVE